VANGKNKNVDASNVKQKSQKLNTIMSYYVFRRQRPLGSTLVLIGLNPVEYGCSCEEKVQN